MVLIPGFFAMLLLSGAASSSLSPVSDGYTSKLSAFPGDSVDLFLHAFSAHNSFALRLYDINGKVVMRWTMDLFRQEPPPDRAYEIGYGYRMTRRISVPDLKSGVYLFENKIPFVVKSRKPEIVVLYPSNTANAYCASGGKSLYGFNSTHQSPATTVSFHRPQSLPRHATAFLKWIAREPFSNVGYITDTDMEEYASIKSSTLLIIPGHSEYWTLQARKNFDRFVSEGRDAMILSGNTMWWQVRYNEQQDQLTCYRRSDSDPVDSPEVKTINWNDISLGYPITFSTGTDFANAGYGLKGDQGWDGYKIINQSPMLEGTGLQPGDILYCPSDEMDGAPLTGLFNNHPVLNYNALGFETVEIVGYDRVSRGGVEGFGTWIVFRRNPSSGIVINTASTDWCSDRGIGKNETIQLITRNMITKLLRKENVFSSEYGSESMN